MISSLPFLSSAEPAFLNELVTHLKFELYQPDDIITSHGTVGKIFLGRTEEYDGDTYIGTSIGPVRLPCFPWCLGQREVW